MIAKGFVSEIEGTVSTSTTKKTSNVEMTAQTPMSVRKRLSLFKGEEKQADTAKQIVSAVVSDACGKSEWKQMRQNHLAWILLDETLTTAVLQWTL